MDQLTQWILPALGALGLGMGFALKPLARAYGARWPARAMAPVMAALGLVAGAVAGPQPVAAILGVASLILLACGVIDYQTRRIPNLLVLALISVAALSSGFELIVTWQAGLIGAVLGVGLLLLVDWIYRLRGRGRGVGMGDIKLMAGIGGLVGPIYVVWVLLGASVLQTLVGLAALTQGKKLHDVLPFGPALALFAIGVLFYLFVI